MVTATKVQNRISDNGNGEVAIANRPSKAEKIVIPKPDFRRFTVTLQGLTPYIMHAFSDKAAQKIKDKQGQKAREARGKREPEKECWAAAYTIKGEAGKKGTVYGIPCRQIKAAMVGACRYVDGVPMTFARGAFWITGEKNVNMATLNSNVPVMREDSIRLPNKALDLRYRPEFQDWSATVTVEYLATAISAEMIVNLLSVAGRCCGIGELRPCATTGPGGNNGLFSVGTTK